MGQSQRFDQQHQNDDAAQYDIGQREDGAAADAGKTGQRLRSNQMHALMQQGDGRHAQHGAQRAVHATHDQHTDVPHG